MTVAEIKALLPSSEVIELNPDAKYILLVDTNWVSALDIHHARAALDEAGINVTIIATCNAAQAVKLLEVE